MPNPLSDAESAVFRSSVQMPDSATVVRGYNFNSGGELCVSDFFKSFFTTGFQATHLSRAVDEVNRMIMARSQLPEQPMETSEFEFPFFRRKRNGCTIFLGYTSNMISSGVRESIRFLVEHELIDCLVTSAGGIEEDLIKCLAPTYLGDFRLDGAHLRKQGLNRIGNLLVPNRNYCLFENWLLPLLDEALKEQNETNFSWTPHKLIHRLGEKIGNEESVLYWAARNAIPVFCPGLTDGSLGDMLYFHSYRNPGLKLDIIEDVGLLNNMAVHSLKTGMIVLGGGLIKHHVYNANLMRNGADFSVLISTAQEFDGSDAGADPDEAVSWGKISIHSNPVKVNCDATIAFPLLVSQTFYPAWLKARAACSQALEMEGNKSSCPNEALTNGRLDNSKNNSAASEPLNSVVKGVGALSAKDRRSKALKYASIEKRKAKSRKTALKKRAAVRKCRQQAGACELTKDVEPNCPPAEQSVARGTLAKAFRTNMLGVRLLIIPFQKNVAFVGSLQFHVLLGECTIFGYKAMASVEEKWIQACSFHSGSSLMYFEANSVLIPPCDVEAAFAQFDVGNAYQDTTSACDVGAVLLVRPMVARELPFERSEVIEMFYGFEEALNKDTSIVSGAAFLNVECEGLLFSPSQDAKSISSEIVEQCIALGSHKLHLALACGAAGVGKSTFLRFVINGLLSVGIQPFLMDLDTGQSEFCRPGCLAIKKIESPLIGPAFGRTKSDPELCYYFGEVSPAERPHVYLQLVSELFQQFTNKVHTGVMLINTNGFVVGVGADILIQIVKMLKPDHVVLLSNQVERRDDDNPSELRELLEPFVRVKLLFTNHCRLGSKGTINNVRLRDIQVASYMFRDCCCLKQFYSKKPFVVLWSKLYVAALCKKLHPKFLMYALNGCLVALCEVAVSSEPADPPSHYFDDHSWPMIPPSNCFPSFIGFGVVRGIDMRRKCFYLISPLSLLEIQRANCILMGDVQIPRDIYLAQIGFLDPSSIAEPEVKPCAGSATPLEDLSHQVWKMSTFRSRNFRITETTRIQRKERRLRARQSMQEEPGVVVDN
uniref:deoxyhypusine synthase n=1 Tax=Trichuris muris TaxID=70415 RepID=A0A5S6QZT4_TRIMR